MSAGPLTLELILVFVMTVFVLNKYGNWRQQHFIVTISTLIGWYFAFVIVFILPLDVALTYYGTCVIKHAPSASTSVSLIPQNFTHKPDTKIVSRRDIDDDKTEQDLTSLAVSKVDIESENLSTTTLSSLSTPGIPQHVTQFCSKPGSWVPNEVLLDLWRIVYWTSQVLTWLILPLMQSYSNSGEFTVPRKLRAALYENAIFYGSYLLLFGVLLIYVAAKGIILDGDKLKVICITASNTWGLFLLVLLLGYGLVEVPRQIWQAGNKGYRLQKIYFDIEKLSADKNDAEETVKEAFRDSEAVINALRDTSGPFRHYADTIMNKFPSEMASELRRRTARSGLNDTDAANISATSEKTLVRLHKRVIEALQSHHRTQAQWNDLIDKALHLEEVAKNEMNGPMHRQFQRTYRAERGIFDSTVCTPIIEWYWECMLKRPLLKAVAILMVVMSFFIIWSECTFFSVHPTFSLAAIFVSSAAKNYSYGYIELSSVVTIAYMCMCAYYTVFKVKVYRYYHLDPHHQTDANSLIFSAILLCRLTPPLCLNFLGMIHLDSHVASDSGDIRLETAYTTIMGHMDVIAIVAKGFNIYFPMAILLLCLGTYFRLGTRVLHQIGIDQFVGDDDMTSELVQGGKALVQVERNRLNRESNREARQEFWQEKLADHDSARPLRRNILADRDSSRYKDIGQPRRMKTGHEYSDRVAIVPEMESQATEDYPVEYRTEENNLNFGLGSRRGDYGTPDTPPKGIFDDL